jgi:acetylornithine deacetylase/succinyl-diaminopimelate desuccinylase-like protein
MKNNVSYSGYAHMNRRHFVAAGAAAAIGRGEEPLDTVYQHIDRNLPAHIERIQQYVRQPSVSAEKIGIPECAELTRSLLRQAGCQETEIIATKGHPAVWGRLDSGAPKTLVIYWMYDVQPVNASEWATPPFEARIVAAPSWGTNGRILRGRGAANQKGPERAFLNAMESILAVKSKLPVNLMFVCEGEEELGSPNLAAVVDKVKRQLSAANGVLFPSVTLGRDGRASFALGNKGVAYIELECRGGAKGGPTQSEIHSSMKAVADSPVWRLVQAVATFTDKSGNHIAIEGFRDRVRKPTGRETDLFETYLAEWDEAAGQRSAQVQRWVDGVEKREALRRLWFEPSLNIDGIWAGYNGPGSKTILPHKANVKIDFRLVPDQRAADIVPLLRKHLDKLGFDDVVVNWWNGYDPSQSDPDSDLVKAALDVYRRHGIRTQVAVRMAGSAPHYLFTRDLQLPLITFGLGLGGGAHGVNEFLVIDAAAPARGLAFLEKSFVDLVYRFAAL